ncbi:substrate-binding domain-containing protein [Micromonospora sp. ATA32]|nr:substrate-binding domain-containing protein [Micromonospora sp. ATA32]
MKRTNLSTLAVAGVLALGLSACSDSTTAEGGKPSGKASGDVTVGFSVYDMQYEFFQKMEKGTREAVEAKGWKFKLHDEKSDENEMVTGAQALLDQGVDVLIISPFKPDALGPIVAKAKQKNIPVIIDDIGGGGTPYDAIVISDNADGGKQAADYLAQQVAANGGKSKKVVSITCEPSAVYAARRNQAFDQQIKDKGFQVVTELSGNSKAEEAYKIMKDALAKDPDVVGVFACNDPMGVAAANAIKDAGKDPVKGIVTVGFNADPEAITAIGKGGLSATIAQDPAGMGAKTVELAAQALNGGKLTYDDESKREVFQKVTLVTKDNVAQFAG